jgi:hypothetical protein
VIYTLRLATDDPAAGAATARAILDADPGRVSCFAIGNEANFYEPSFDAYAARVDAYMAALADPRARYCGPDAGPHDWVSGFAERYASRGDVVSANVHIYYGVGTQITAPDARDQLLSTALVDTYQSDHDDYVPAVAATGMPLRVAEVNSYASGGCPGASDAFASALWGLDYLHWWSTHGASGVDFHTGDHVSGASTTYALFSTAAGGYHVKPLGYAVKAFALGGHGTPVATSVETAANVTAYAVRDGDTLAITLVNKTHDADARDVDVAIAAGGATTGHAWRLAAPDVAATDGVTLGSAPIGDDASWAGTPEQVELASVHLPAASAVVILVP